MSQSNKDFVKKASELLKDQGHFVPVSALYEVFAKLGGFNDWNTASAMGAEFSVRGAGDTGAVPYDLHPSELKIINHIISDMDHEDKRLRPSKTIRFVTTARARCRFDATFILKKGVEPTEETISVFRSSFLDQLEDWENMAPADRKHIDVDVEYVDDEDLGAEEIDVEVGKFSDTLDRRLNVGPIRLPSLEDYGKIAEGLRIRREKISRGYVTFPDNSDSIQEQVSLVTEEKD
jgi:hypothetical protein